MTLRNYVLVPLLAASWLFAAPAIMAQDGPPSDITAVPKGQASASVAHPLTKEDVELLIDGFLPYALKRADVAGAVVTVVKDGQTLLSKGYGVADRQTNEPVDPEQHLFRQGSISKLFTWVAVMQQVEAGRIDLDVDINQYLDFKIPNTWPEPITMRHIMTHTSGFSEAVKHLIVVGQGKPIELEAFLSRWVPERIYRPGTVSAYSNYATALAGLIVQRVSGEKFEDYIERHILAPANMKHSSMTQPLPAPLAPLMSKGYMSSREPAQEFEVVNPSPAGALSASGADMGRFMIALLNKGEGPGGRILTPESLAQMWKPQYRPLPNHQQAMGLGFYEQSRHGYRIMGHGGDTLQFHSDLSMWLDEGVGLFISMNSMGDNVSRGPIRSELRRMFADRYFPANEKAVVAEVAHVKRKVPVAGTFYTSRRAEGSLASTINLFNQGDLISHEDGTVTFTLFNDYARKPKHWREVAPDRWQEVGGDSMMYTTTDESGRVTAITTDDIPPAFIVQPIPAAINKGWNLPALGLTLILTLFTAIWWPVAALVRRHYHAGNPLKGSELLADRLVRGSSLMAFCYLTGLAAAVALGSDQLMFGNLDLVLRLLQLVGLLAVLGIIPAAWRVWQLWTTPTGWWSRIRGGLMLLMFGYLLWFIGRFDLISLSLNY